MQTNPNVLRRSALFAERELLCREAIKTPAITLRLEEIAKELAFIATQPPYGGGGSNVSN